MLTKTRLTKNQGLEYLLMKVYLLSLEGLIFHQTENSFYYQLECGRKTQNLIRSIVPSFIARTLWKNLPL